MTRRDALREIVMLTFPMYRGSKLSIDVADRVDRRVEEDVYYIDWIVDLAHIEEAGPNLGGDGGRYVLPLSSGILIGPGQSAQIIARAHVSGFRCERFVISSAGTPGGAADWVVNDLRIGNRSQFSQSGDVPGDMFATAAIDAFVSFDTVRAEMDVVAVVTYVGPVESGVPFFASMIGRQIVASPHYVRVLQPDASHRRDGSVCTKIPLGSAYVSQRVDVDDSGDGEDTSITIYVPPIDQATIDVAVDATLRDGKPTQAVDTMIGHALGDRDGLVRDAYVALVAQRAGALSAGEMQAGQDEVKTTRIK